MSSRTYETDLSPDPTLRTLLLVSLAAAYVIGFGIIVILPVDDLQQLLAALSWSLFTGREWRDMTKAHKRWRCIRLASDGTASLLDFDGIWHPASISDNCVVLSKFAWLILSTANADRCYELMRGNSIESEQWRRLQVIWRHMGRGS